ncbi:hypothetical protein HY230_12095 [Candidatus Acetothermia bacterium]|nr:hypothetical protein [Candidatus Acetothermia bacterium]
MGEKPQNSADSRTRFWLIAGLMVISTVLFIIGGMMERNPSEAGEAPGVHEEAGERAHQEPASNERVLGFNLENPWAITVVASVWFVLAAGLFRWGQRLLVPVAILAAATAFVDVREVLLQLGQSRTSIALLAGIVTVAHVAVAIFALVTWGAFRRSSA